MKFNFNAKIIIFLLLVKSGDQEKFPVKSPGSTSAFDAIRSGTLTNGRFTGTWLKNAHLSIFAHRGDVRSAWTPRHSKNLFFFKK